MASAIDTSSAESIELLDRRLRNRTPQRSQRTGVSLPPPDAKGVRHNEDYRALFERWIKDPCRPDRDAIVVDSTTSPEECLDYILKQIVPSTGVQTSNGQRKENDKDFAEKE